MIEQRIGVLVGMQSEARLAKYLNPVAIEASGATLEGAKLALQRLIDAGVNAIVSFGFAAGLDPLIKPGTILMPHSIHTQNQDYVADPILRSQLGSEQSEVKVGALLHSDTIVTSAVEKGNLFDETGCVAVDMESGLVAHYCYEHDIPFAVLRVVCDSAVRSLPPVACMALSQDGSLNSYQIVKSLLAHPSQIKTLISVGVDAIIAYWQLNHFVAHKRAY